MVGAHLARQPLVMIALPVVLLLSAAPGRATSVLTTPQPQQIHVLAGAELDVKDVEGRQVSALSTRFYPGNIRVHRGDTLRFTTALPNNPVALLPPAVSNARQWVKDHAFGFDHPWYPVAYDPDDRWAKINNIVAFPPSPPCGAPGESVCTFPVPADKQAAQDSRWGFQKNPPEEVRGVLGFGMPEVLDVRVTIQAEPGTTMHMVSLFSMEAVGTITVVADDEPLPTADELQAQQQQQIAADARTAAELDRSYSTYRSKTKLRDGSTQWQALIGVDEGPVALRQAYPKTLDIKRGDTVVWSPREMEHLVHTVTFPRDEAVESGAALYSTWCDLDGDDGSLPDSQQTAVKPVFCPGGWAQVEFDLNPLMGLSSTDNVHAGDGDLDSSGIMGMAPDVIDVPFLDQDVHPTTDEFKLRFVKRSSPDGFAYGCALHGWMEASVVVR